MKDFLIKAATLALLLTISAANSAQGIDDFVVGDFEAGFTEGFDSVYLEHCAVCHGDKMQGESATGGAALVGGRSSLTSGKPLRTVESYWPYATTLFDYVRRAMPFDEPGALADDEVYALVAYILGKAKIVDHGTVLDSETLPAVEMPNRRGFISDARPDVFNYD